MYTMLAVQYRLKLAKLTSLSEEAMRTIVRGGPDPERVYLKDLHFMRPCGEYVCVTASDFPCTDMTDVIARHRARYYLVGLFCRPSYRLLDFPCGSGYASELLAPLGMSYTGLDYDQITVEYARLLYGRGGVEFGVGDLSQPHLPTNAFDVAACIEGLEHVGPQHQDNLIRELASSLKPNGTLVVSTPESPTGVSGRSAHNPHHLGELTKPDFIDLLRGHFPNHRIELVTVDGSQLSTGVTTTMLFGICKGLHT